MPAPVPNPAAPDTLSAAHGSRRARVLRRARRPRRRRATLDKEPTMAASPPRGLNVRQRTPVSARARQAELPPQLQKYVQTGETLVAEPFKGITLDGSPLPDLFPIQKTRCRDSAHH